MKIYPIVAISTDGVQQIRDNWSSLTDKQKEVLKDIRNQALPFKTVQAQGKTWRVFLASMKDGWLSRLDTYLGNDFRALGAWYQDGTRVPEYPLNESAIMAAVPDLDDQGTRPADIDEAIATCPVIFGQRKRVA